MVLAGVVQERRVQEKGVQEEAVLAEGVQKEAVLAQGVQEEAVLAEAVQEGMVHEMGIQDGVNQEGVGVLLSFCEITMVYSNVSIIVVFNIFNTTTAPLSFSPTPAREPKWRPGIRRAHEVRARLPKRHELGAKRAAHALELLCQLDLSAQGLHFKLFDALVHPQHLRLQVKHPLHPSKVEPKIDSHLVDAPQLLDVLLGIQPRPLGRALGLDEPTRLVHPQSLWMHAGKLRSHRDHEHPAVGLHLDMRDTRRRATGPRSLSAAPSKLPCRHRLSPASADCPAPANSLARGLPFITFDSSPTAVRCSSLSCSGTSSVKR